MRGLTAPGAFEMWVSVDPTGVVRRVRAAAGYAGWSVEAGAPLDEGLDALGREAVQRSLRRALAGEAFTTCFVLSSEGSADEHRFDVHFVPGAADSGTAEVAILVRETSQVHGREQERQLLRDALDTTGDAVVICRRDDERTVVFANASFLGLVGRPERAVIGHALSLPATWETTEGHQAQLVLFDGRSQLIGVRVGGGEAGLREHELALSCVVDREGKATHVVGVFRDVSRQRELETQVRRAAALEAVGHLAGSAAHDLNSQLAAMSVELSALRAARSEEEAAASIQLVESSLHQARALLGRLLAMTRVEAPQVARLDLAQLLREQERLLRAVADERVDLRVRIDAEPAWVFADATLLEQVFLNLVTNARDAMPDGGALELRLLVEGNLAVLVVQDEGVGMSMATRQRAFEPFFSTKGTRGTGLGLGTVQRIIDEHGGTVALESQPNLGTCVTLRLPLAAARAASEPAAAEPASEPAGSGRAESLSELPTSGAVVSPRTTGEFEAEVPAHVLVVEDQDVLRRGVARGLVRAGFRVSEARDGVDALEVLEREPSVEVVLSDVVMPRMDGFELARRLRERHPQVGILLMSGYSDPSTGEAPPGVELVKKPFRTAELLEKLAALVVR